MIPRRRSEAPIVLHIYDRVLNRWEAMPSHGGMERIFGNWLAFIVVHWRPGNQDHPGHENEARYPYTGLYAPFPSVVYPDNEYFPGDLILRNLADGRVITIRTGQEDSEVLDVRRDGLVLYRVNDEIFSARMEGDKLSPAKLVVKGQDVPEVHWVFWSAAKPPAQASKPVSAAAH